MSEEQAPAAATKKNRKWVALAIGGGCALIACVGVVAALALSYFSPQFAGTFNRFISGTSATPATDQAGGLGPSAGSSVAQSGSTMGDPNAPVKIVEYSDFQCPFCRRFAEETEPQIVETYVNTGKVFFEYRSVGAFIGQESADAAEAAYCAGDQGKFWQYHDTLFANWTGENVGDFTNAKLKQFAGTLSLDRTAFDKCLDTGKYTDRLAQDVANAQTDGVRATPSFLINGKLLEGAQPFDAFQKAIDEALQGK